MISNPIGGLGGMNINFPKPAPPAPAHPTGDAAHDAILKRLHTIEQLLIKNMHHTEAVINEAVQHILKAQRGR